MFHILCSSKMGAMAKKWPDCVGGVKRKTIRATLSKADLFTY